MPILETRGCGDGGTDRYGLPSLDKKKASFTTARELNNDLRG